MGEKQFPEVKKLLGVEERALTLSCGNGESEGVGGGEGYN